MREQTQQRRVIGRKRKTGGQSKKRKDEGGLTDVSSLFMLHAHSATTAATRMRQRQSEKIIITQTALHCRTVHNNYTTMTHLFIPLLPHLQRIIHSTRFVFSLPFHKKNTIPISPQYIRLQHSTSKSYPAPHKIDTNQSCNNGPFHTFLTLQCTCRAGQPLST